MIFTTVICCAEHHFVCSWRWALALPSAHCSYIICVLKTLSCNLTARLKRGALKTLPWSAMV